MPRDGASRSRAVEEISLPLIDGISLPPCGRGSVLAVSSITLWSRGSVASGAGSGWGVWLRGNSLPPCGGGSGWRASVWAGPSAYEERWTAVDGRSGRAPTSGAIAISGVDAEGTVEARAGDAVASGRLEVETRCTDVVGASAEGSARRLSVDEGVAPPTSASRCSADDPGLDESLEASAEEVALSCTDAAGGAIARPSPAEVASGTRCARGKSNRASLLDSKEGVSGTVSVEVLVPLTGEGRSVGDSKTIGKSIGDLCSIGRAIGALWGRARSTGAVCTIGGFVGAFPTRGRSIGARSTGAVSFGSGGLGDGSTVSLTFWGMARRGKSIEDSLVSRCTLRSGTRLIGAPRPIRRDWPSVSRWAGTGAISAGASL